MAANSVLVQLAQIKAENSQFNMAFQKMEKQVKSTNQVMKGQAAVFGSIMKLFGAGLSVGLVIAGIKSLANEMDMLKTKAAEANMSVRGIQVLDFIARNNATSLEALVGMQSKLNIKLGEANEKAGTAREAFRSLGIDINTLNKISEDEKLSYVAKAISNAENPTQALAAATEILGKEAIKTKGALEALGMDYETLAKNAEKSRQVVSAAAIDGVDALGDQLSNSNKSLKAMAQELIGVGAGLTTMFSSAGGNAEKFNEATIRTKGSLQGLMDKLYGTGTFQTMFPKWAADVDKVTEETRQLEEQQRAQNAALEETGRLADESYGKLQTNIQTLVSNGMVPLTFKLLELESAKKRAMNPEEVAAIEEAILKLKDTSRKAAWDYINSQDTEEQKYVKLQDRIKELIKLHPDLGDSLKKALESADPALKKRLDELDAISSEISKLNNAAMTAEERRDERIKGLDFLSGQTDSFGNKTLDKRAYDAELKRIQEEYEAEKKKGEKKEANADPMFAKDTAGWLQTWDGDGNGSITKQLELLKVQLDAGKISWEEYTKAVSKAQDSYEAFGFIGDSLREGLMEISEAIVTNFKSVGDVVKQVIMKIIQQYIMLKVIGGFGSNFGGSGAGTGIMGKIGDIFSGVKTNARGGYLPQAEWSWVGEEGPELVNFRVPSRVYSNDDSMKMIAKSGKNQTIIYSPNIYTSDVASMTAWWNQRKMQEMDDFKRFVKKTSIRGDD
jgi:hypothetical protein